LAWEREPRAGSCGRQPNEEPEPPALEDERFLDHHIEEILSHAARTREGGLDGERQSLN
jgi:hypothetical protein